MKAIYFWVSDELHKNWRGKLAAMGATGKTVLITFIESFVDGGQSGEKGKKANREDSKKATK